MTRCYQRRKGVPNLGVYISINQFKLLATSMEYRNSSCTGLNDEALKIYQGSKGRVNRQVSTLKHYTSTSISRFVVKFHALHIKNNDVNKLSFHIVNAVSVITLEKKISTWYFLHRYFYLRVAKLNFISSFLFLSLSFFFHNNFSCLHFLEIYKKKKSKFISLPNIKEMTQVTNFKNIICSISNFPINLYNHAFSQIIEAY